MYSAVISILTPIQEKMYRQKKTQTMYVWLNICI